ncbi:IS66 family insertion sequence element accessory protein TnpB, partial [Phocaeicola vulgatus]|uniref:IS66 family insertion sequence element accessory protein TnpB n=1 Tax=Phocaeicola vulgatus TaxID=821 RepID=UPI00216AD8A0
SNEGVVPISGDVFLFFGKNRQSVKILRWDGDGFLLYYKRLEGGSFELPTFNPHIGNYEISYQILSFILNGVSLKSVRLRKCFMI